MSIYIKDLIISPSVRKTQQKMVSSDVYNPTCVTKTYMFLKVHSNKDRIILRKFESTINVNKCLIITIVTARDLIIKSDMMSTRLN